MRDPEAMIQYYGIIIHLKTSTIEPRGELFDCPQTHAHTHSREGTLAARGLEEPFFPVVLYVVSVFGSGRK
jgi:hypothetical protein